MARKPRLLKILESFVPPPTRLSYKERVRVVIGALIGIGLAAVLSGLLRDQMHLASWLFASLGASAVLVFVVPGSPFSQPWPVIGGNALSAVAGILSFHFLGHNALAAGIAVAAAIALMLQLRALHPPGGGTALLAVLAQTNDWHFVLFPVAFSATALVLAGVAYHHLTRHSYPQRQTISLQPHQLALHRFVPADLENALLGYNQALTISRDDIELLIEQTEMQAYQRLASGLTCGEIMVIRLRTITPRTALGVAIATMQRYDIKVLPVVDADRKLMGLLRLDDALTSDPSLPAGQIMRQTFARVKAGDSAVDLLHILAKGDRRHVMVIDDANRLEGMVSKSDLMRALFHAG